MSNPHFFFSHVALICKGLFFLAHLKCAELATYFASLNVRSSLYCDVRKRKAILININETSSVIFRLNDQLRHIKLAPLYWLFQLK